MASHDKKILKPWIGKSWEAIRGATTPGGAVSPGEVDENVYPYRKFKNAQGEIVDEFEVAYNRGELPRVYSKTEEEKEMFGNEIPPEVQALQRFAEGKYRPKEGWITGSVGSPVPASAGSTAESPSVVPAPERADGSAIPKSALARELQERINSTPRPPGQPIPEVMELGAERPGETTRVASGVPGVTAVPKLPPSDLDRGFANPNAAKDWMEAEKTKMESWTPQPSTAEERAAWDKTLKEVDERLAAEEAKRSPTYTPSYNNESLRGLETVPTWYRLMNLAGAGKPGYGVAMSSTGHMTVGTPSGRIISNRPGAAIEDAQQEILGRVNYLQNTPVEKQYQDYLSENKKQYPKGPITTKLNKWGTTSIEGKPLDFETFKRDIPARIEDSLGSLERLSGIGKEAPPTDYLSAVPKPFAFSNNYQKLYSDVAGWSQKPEVYKKELAVAIPLLDKIGKHELDAYNASALPEIWKTQVTSDIERKKMAEGLGLTKAKIGQIGAEISAIPSDIKFKEAQTKKLEKETETGISPETEIKGLLTMIESLSKEEMFADPATKASNAEMRKLLLARLKKILGVETAGEDLAPKEGDTKISEVDRKTKLIFKNGKWQKG